MKKLLIILAVSSFSFGCASNDEVTTEEKTTEVGIQNVNGNIPDTTNSIDLSTSGQDTVLLNDQSKK